MAKVEPIKVLTIDEKPLEVSELSEIVQQLVAVFDDWNQKEADARDHLAMISAARETLTRQIITQVRQDAEAADETNVAVADIKESPEDDKAE